MLNKLRRVKLGRQGFTLVELLVVIAILGILAAIVIPKLANQTDAARMGEVKADTRTLDDAMQLYYTNNGTYAGAVGSLSAYVAAVPSGPSGKTFQNALGTSLTFSAYTLSGVSRVGADFSSGYTANGGIATIEDMSTW